MNSEARENINNCKDALSKALAEIKNASSLVENSQIRNRINAQKDSIQHCLIECDDISSGISQHIGDIR